VKGAGSSSTFQRCLVHCSADAALPRGTAPFEPGPVCFWQFLPGVDKLEHALPMTYSLAGACSSRRPPGGCGRRAQCRAGAYAARPRQCLAAGPRPRHAFRFVVTRCQAGALTVARPWQCPAARPRPLHTALCRCHISKTGHGSVQHRLLARGRACLQRGVLQGAGKGGAVAAGWHAWVTSNSAHCCASICSHPDLSTGYRGYRREAR